MNESTLTAISPLDGRYAGRLTDLRPLFSEYGLIRQRVRVEALWLKALATRAGIPELGTVDDAALAWLDQLATSLSRADAERVKELERTTNHDVKAVEYFVKSRLEECTQWHGRHEFVHFGATSEDINNLSYALILKEARANVLLPAIDDLVGRLTAIAHREADTAMMSHTHGQPATPTTLGKEIAVFVDRLRRQRQQFAAVAILGKMNGAVGNMNAHVTACPEVDWLAVSRDFVTSLGLEWSAYTTQIEPHDWIAEYCHALERMGTILIDLCRDVWGYISLGYFRQRAIAGEVGSSTMPHKVNPIDFENGEGNLGIANALLAFMAAKLPVSRWQRDLTDSTVMRNLGVAIGHAVLGWRSIGRGLDRVEADAARMRADLDANWELLAEPIQTVMRRYGVADAYEQLKSLTRGQRVTPERLQAFIAALDIPREARTRLLELTPADYRGLADRLAREI
jgi:adenylosuccinate lyase